MIKAYNIHNKQEPVLVREVKLEGSLMMVRKIEDDFYIATDKYVNYSRYNGSSEEYIKKAMIPVYKDSLVNDKEQFIPINDIRYCEWAPCSNYTVLAHFNIHNQESIEFNVLLANESNLYINQELIYLVNTLSDLRHKYSDNYNLSVIIKYAISLDKINYKCFGSVPGIMVNETAMDVYKGNFRIETINPAKMDKKHNIYVLDNKLKVISNKAV